MQGGRSGANKWGQDGDKDIITKLNETNANQT